MYNSMIQKNIDEHYLGIVTLKKEIGFQIIYFYKCFLNAGFTIEQLLKSDIETNTIQNELFQLKVEIVKNTIQIMFIFYKPCYELIQHVCNNDIHYLCNILKKYKYFKELLYTCVLWSLHGKQISIKSVQCESLYNENNHISFHCVIEFKYADIVLSTEDKLELENLISYDSIYDIDRNYIWNLGTSIL